MHDLATGECTAVVWVRFEDYGHIEYYHISLVKLNCLENSVMTDMFEGGVVL